MKPLHKARSSQHRVYLYNFIGKLLQLAGELHSTSSEEVTDQSIAQKLSGSRLEEHSETSEEANVSLKQGINKFTFTDLASSDLAIQDVRNDKTTTNWAIWENNDTFDALVLTGSGSGGYKEVEAQLAPGKVVYALLGLPTTEGDYTTIKYILVTWVGDGVKPLVKAKSSQDRVQLYTHISKYLQLGGEWQAQSLEEIAEAKLISKLEGSVFQEEKVASEKTYKATINDGISRFNPDYQPVSTGPVKVDFANEEESVQALQEIRDGTNDTNWVIFGYQGNATKISLLGKGKGDFLNIEPFLEDNTVIYAILGVPFGTEDYVQVKFCFISWVGPRAKPLLKARSSQHRVALYNFSQTIFPMAGEIQALSRDELSNELIRKKLIGTTVLNEEQQTSHQGRSANTRKEGVEKFEIANQNELDAALKEVRDDGSLINWAIVDYVEDSPVLQLLKSGTGGLEAVTPLLEDDKVVYVVFGTIQDDGDYSQVKYIFVTFIGKDVKPLHKARSSQHRVKLYNYIQGFMQLAGEIQILNKDDLNEVNLVSKLIGSRAVTESDAKQAQRKVTIAKGSMEKFQFTNEDEVNSSIESLRKDDGNDFVVLGEKEAKDKISVVATGKGSLEEVKSFFEDDLVRYAIIRYKVVEVVDDVDYTRTKNMFISWTGPDVKPLAKARSSQHRVPIYEYALKIIALHGQLHYEKKSDLSDDEIIEKFSGARTQRESVIQQEAERLKSISTETKSKTVESETNIVDISTFFKEEDKVAELLKEMRLVGSDTTWIALKLQGNDVIFVGSGTGGVDELKSQFSDDSVHFAVACVREDEKLTSEGYATKKFVQVNWVGKEVKPMDKAKSSQLRVPLNTFLFNKYLQLAAEFQALTLDDVTEESLRDKVTGSRVKAE